MMEDGRKGSVRIGGASPTSDRYTKARPVCLGVGQNRERGDKITTAVYPLVNDSRE